MMEVEKPWEFKEDVEIMEDDDFDDDAAAAAGGLLHTRRDRKSKKTAENGDEEELLKAAQEEESQDDDEGEEHNTNNKTVFFHPTKGLWKCRHCDWTHRLSGPCRDDILNHQGYCQIARNLEPLVQNEPFYYSSDKGAENEVTEVLQVGDQKENANETSIAESKELEKQENVAVQETNHESSNGKLENGSHTNGVHEISSSSETVTIAHGETGLKLIATIGESKNISPNWSGALEISNGKTSRTEAHEVEVEKDENVTKGKVNIEEYDLEKILDEQETHDLYCPNCNSCLTRRVILKKRKRTVRQAKHEEPPKRPQLAEPSANVSNQAAAERQDQESLDVFRCLSCFTFFIPTGCGFNIFRIFERSANQQVQVQHSSASRETSEICGSWLLSCFQTVDSPKKSADADPLKKPPLSGSQSTNDKTSVEDNTSSERSHATTTTAKNEDEIKQSFTEFHGTTSSSATIQTSSSTTSKISSWQSDTGFLRTEAGCVVTVQRDGARQEQIPLSKPADDTVTDAIHLDRKEDIQENPTPAYENSLFFNQTIFNSELKVPTRSPTKKLSDIQENATASSANSSVFNQTIFNSELKVSTAGPTKILSEVGNLTGEKEKPTSIIPQPVQSEATPHIAVQVPDAAVPETPVPAPAQRDEWDILKAIVYGGLVESIMSLSVVSAAAASGTKTLDIFVLGIANLIGGLPIIFHNIADLRNIGDVAENNEQVGHYWLELGRRSKYQLHVVIAILSYILFGLLPPVVYGLSFCKSDNRENKMMVVAAASLVCIGLLAIGKAHVKRPRTYITTLLYYLSIGLSGSGLSYVAGVLITRLLAHFGLIDQGGASAPAPPSLLFPDAMGADGAAWASF